MVATAIEFTICDERVIWSGIAERSRMAELPIACTLTSEALRTRREGLMDLVRRVERRVDLSDGLRLETSSAL